MQGSGMTINQIIQHQEAAGIVSKADFSTQLMSLIKLNHQLLESCPRHDFSIELDKRVFSKKYECVHCGGEVGETEKRWYEKGLSHASSMENP